MKNFETMIERARHCIQALRDARKEKPSFGCFLSTAHHLTVDDALALFDARCRANVPIFDPYLASGYDPSEDQISRALAELFNPAGRHGFGSLFLKALVRAACTYGEYKARADRIIASIDHGGLVARVERPYRDPFDKIDIVVFGRGYVVAIENKKRGGGEGVTSRGLQTLRYSAVLKKMAERAGQPIEQIAIYLSPEGSRPYDGGFIPLRVSDLILKMREALDNPPERARAEDIALAHAFLSTYSRIS